MRLSRKQRQEIIDGYLAESGANHYVPDEFVGWLSDRPEHPAYDWFEWDDGKAGHAHRLSQARAFVKDLRISFSLETVGRNKAVKVSVQEMPAMVSPVEGRRSGGGYIPLSADDPVAMDAYCAEASRALDAWCRRYEGAVAYRGGNVAAVRKLVGLLMTAKSEAA